MCEHHLKQGPEALLSHGDGIRDPAGPVCTHEGSVCHVWRCRDSSLWRECLGTHSSCSSCKRPLCIFVIHGPRLLQIYAEKMGSGNRLTPSAIAHLGEFQAPLFVSGRFAGILCKIYQASHLGEEINLFKSDDLILSFTGSETQILHHRGLKEREG